MSVEAHETVIGPAAREWDMVLIVEYRSRRKFLEMATDAEYLKIHEHRAPGLADSRLLAFEALCRLAARAASREAERRGEAVL